MRNLKIIVQYLGSRFHGWQVQIASPTLQEILQDILSDILQEKIVVLGSGRTDAGVHALAQVAHFRTSKSLDTDTLKRALNAHLPKDVAILSVEEVPDEFHAQMSAKNKTYSYFILNSYQKIPLLNHIAWRVFGTLDFPAMRECLGQIVGEHDFSAFKASDASVKTFVRRIEQADIQRIPLEILANRLGELVSPAGLLGPLQMAPTVADDPRGPALVAITVRGNGFLKHMVRNIVGTIVAVGLGKMTIEEFRKAFASKDRRQAGVTAPAWGLFLMKVGY